MNYVEKTELKPDNLLIGNTSKIMLENITIPKNTGILLRGTVIGKGNTGYGIIDNTNFSIPYGILTDDIDATNEDVSASIYLSGIFNKNAVTVSDGINIDDYKLEFRKLSIYFEDVQ